MDKPLRILSLGAGVQSSTLALMIEKGEIPMVDGSIFADTQAESKKTYDFLNWLKTKISYPIYYVSKGNLTEQLLKSDFPIAPFFNQHTITGKKGLMRRQCTNDYKISIITQKVRQLLGLKKRQRVKKNMKVEMLMGISKDEIFRMKPNRLPYIKNIYPLVDMNMRRQDCVDWFNKYYDKTPPRSACIYCPYKNNKEWLDLKENEPEEFKFAVDFDKKIRNNSRDKNQKVYVHKSCKPLGDVVFEKQKDEPSLFDGLCEGYCGN
jgi:hypothetical protein